MPSSIVKKTKQKNIAPPADKKPIAEVRKENEVLKAENEKLKESAYCRMCDKIKLKSQFYVSTDPRIAGGITPICKRCALLIGERADQNGDLHEPTKESVMEAMRYLDKPFIEDVWSTSVAEASDKSLGRTKNTAYRAYVKNIQLPQYYGKTFKDSDMFKEHIVYDDERTEEDIINDHSGQDTYDSYLKNKADVIRLLDYDPFEQEPVRDQPFLYSQLLGMLDASEDANEDMMRVSSAIQIVRGFLQQAKIDDAIAKLMGDISQIQENSATIKSLQDSKQKLTSMITNLAAESCLSLKNSKKQTRGSDTWTGKIKTIKDLTLREGTMNGFDVMTCRGMAQVQEISDASIMKQLALDESEWSDMVAEMRVVSQRLRKERDSYKELNRILLTENIDLKDYMSEKGIHIPDNTKNLKDLYSVFSDEESGIEFDDSDIVDIDTEDATNESDNPSV
jgi:regulator of replication initiation timing